MSNSTSAPAGIHQALAKVNSAISAIGKDQESKGTFSFKFRGIDDVLNVLHPLLSEHEIVIAPEVVSYEATPTAKGYHILATIRHHFIHSSGSSISTLVVGEGADSGDKAMNKALSIALKYALFQLFSIPTKDMADPDRENVEIDHAAPAPAPAPAPAAPSGPEYQAQLQEAFRQMATATNREELAVIFRAFPEYLRKDRTIVDEASRISKTFTANTPAA